MGWTPTEWYGGKRGGPVNDRDRALLRAVDLLDRTMCGACGHSTLETMSTEDMGHFKMAFEYCEACRVREQYEESSSTRKHPKGQKHYVIDRRKTEE